MESEYLIFSFLKEDPIYELFYYNYHYHNQYDLNYKEYVEKQDIGLTVIQEIDIHTTKYKITDKHKWFLAKIKYGI